MHFGGTVWFWADLDLAVLEAESSPARSSVGGAIWCAAQSIATVLDAKPASCSVGGAAWMHAHVVGSVFAAESSSVYFGGAARMHADSL
jgi:hypothetical protein